MFPQISRRVKAERSSSCILPSTLLFSCHVHIKLHVVCYFQQKLKCALACNCCIDSCKHTAIYRATFYEPQYKNNAPRHVGLWGKWILKHTLLQCQHAANDTWWTVTDELKPSRGSCSGWWEMEFRLWRAAGSPAQTRCFSHWHIPSIVIH